jgi:dipeptidyl aminopeptidase/acylaminoacyl peptidase
MLEDGGNPRGYAIEWVGNRNNVGRIAAQVSPLTYVRAGLPPILTIHGDADKLVPVSHARRLHEALQTAGATSELLILPGAGHGDFNPQQARQATDAVRAFLVKAGIIK